MAGEVINWTFYLASTFVVYWQYSAPKSATAPSAKTLGFIRANDKFKLKHIDETQPAGAESDLRMSWFWLTDGDLWLNLADSTLYEYSKDALKYFGDKKLHIMIIR